MTSSTSSNLPPLGLPRTVQFQDAHGLAVGIVLPRPRELGLLGGELADDLFRVDVPGGRAGRIRPHGRRRQTQQGGKYNSTHCSPLHFRRNHRTQQFLGDRQQLHVAGAFVDAADLDVAVELLHRIVPGNAHAAEHLDGLRSHLFRDFRRVILGHGGLGDERHAGIPQARGVIDQQARRLQFRGHDGQVPLHHLELRDGLAELLALPGVSGGMFQRAARQADHLRADADAALVERLDGDLVALAHLAHHVFPRHAAVVQDQLAGRGRANARACPPSCPPGSRGSPAPPGTR